MTLSCVEWALNTLQHLGYSIQNVSLKLFCKLLGLLFIVLIQTKIVFI
jgi:hypothetical protein